MPAALAVLFFEYVSSLQQGSPSGDKTGLEALGLTTLALLCSTPGGAAIAQGHLSSSDFSRRLLHALASCNSSLLKGLSPPFLARRQTTD